MQQQQRIQHKERIFISQDKIDNYGAMLTMLMLMTFMLMLMKSYHAINQIVNLPGFSLLADATMQTLISSCYKCQHFSMNDRMVNGQHNDEVDIQNESFKL